MPDITLQPVSVMADGGAREGHLALADNRLVAVLSRVTAEETAGELEQTEGWFLEAGFGPCGPLMSVTPPVFVSLEQAVEWVQMRLESGLV